MRLEPELIKPGTFNYFSVDGGASEASVYEYSYRCDVCLVRIAVDRESDIPVHEPSGMNVCDKCIEKFEKEDKNQNMKYKTEGLNELSKQLNEFVCSIGFDNNDVPLRIALIHSEISEAFEAYRKDKLFKLNESQKNVLKGWVSNDDFKKNFAYECKDTFEDEIADSIIRLLDLCGKMNIDIEYHIQQKMRYNSTRGFKYGGKKF